MSFDANDGTREGAQSRSTLARAVLSRHPIVVDALRTAAEVTGVFAEAVVFDTDRVFLIGSTRAESLQPRHMNDAESTLVGEGEGPVHVGEVSAYPIVDPEGRLVGALIVGIGAPTSGVDAGLRALSRIVSALLSLSPDSNETGSLETTIVQAIRDVVMVIDDAFIIRWVNRAVGSLLRRTPAEMIGRSAVDFVHPDDLERTLEAIARIHEGLETYRVTARVSRGDGSWAGVEATAVDHSDDPTVGGLVLTLRSVPGDRELAVSIDHNRLVSDAIVGGLHDGIVATDGFGAVTRVNQVARAMFNLDPEISVGHLALEDFALFDENGSQITPAEPHPAGRAFERSDQQLRLPPRDDGNTGSDEADRFVTMRRQRVMDAEGTVLGSVVIFHDTTASHIAAAELRRQALHDDLTGLPNRRHLENRLIALRSMEPAQPTAACFIDLDAFKLINDTYGHRIGDRVVQLAAQRLRSQVPDPDLLFRLGGDEMVVLQLGVEDVDRIVPTADRLRRALSEPFTVDDQRFDLTASVGVAITSSADLGDGRLLQNADIALYAAKERGRNRVEVFGADLADAVRREERQRRVLRDALENDLVTMHFQPIVDVATGAVAGYEALARLHKKSGEILSPDAFMGSLHDTGLIWSLDKAAFAMSCRAAALLARHQPDRPPTIACNFSSSSIGRPSFLQTLTETVESFGVDPQQICIEITESAALDAGPGSLRVLTECRRLGYQLALDDFGTGFSSLAHLRDLPITSVKVDRSFIGRFGEDGPEQSIASAIVSLAHQLGLDVVAEGVESAEQLARVRQLGFTWMQGWHFAPAVPLAEVMERWVEPKASLP